MASLLLATTSFSQLHAAFLRDRKAKLICQIFFQLSSLIGSSSICVDSRKLLLHHARARRQKLNWHTQIIVAFCPSSTEIPPAVFTNFNKIQSELSVNPSRQCAFIFHRAEDCSVSSDCLNLNLPSPDVADFHINQRHLSVVIAVHFRRISIHFPRKNLLDIELHRVMQMRMRDCRMRRTFDPLPLLKITKLYLNDNEH